MYLDELIDDLSTLSEITETLNEALEGRKRKEPLTFENGQGLFDMRDFLLDLQVRLRTLVPRGPIPTLGPAPQSSSRTQQESPATPQAASHGRGPKSPRPAKKKASKAPSGA